MTEAEAEHEVRRRNREHGARGEEYGFFMAVPGPDDTWLVEFQEERPGWFRRLTNAVFSMPQ